jgi:hypothetical protein
MNDLSLVSCLVAGALALGFAGCEDKPKEIKASELDAGEPKAAVDPSLAKAVAEAKAKRDAGPAAQGDGPPESGVFEPGKADAQLKKGAPPKLSLGSEGKVPRVVLAAPVAPGWKESGSMSLTLKLGRGALPQIGVDLALEAPKGPAAPAPDAAKPAGNGTAIVAKIKDVKLEGDVGPQGRQLAGELAKMRGSRIDYRLVDGGGGVDYSYQLAKGASPDLDMVLRAVTEALESVTLGYPKEAVGEGGYWLVTTRGTDSGTEVIAYRMIKLDKMEGEALTLSVTTKRYAVSTKLSLPGLPPGSEIDQFQSTTEAKLSATKGSPVASSGTTKQSFLAALQAADGQPDSRLAIQSVAEVSVHFGKK